MIKIPVLIGAVFWLLAGGYGAVWGEETYPYKLFMTGYSSPPHDEKGWLPPKEGDSPLRDFHGKRSDLRISLYAPPSIPHEVEPQSEKADCLDCHADNRTDAPMISHQAYENCRQCHVPQEKTGLFRRNGSIKIPDYKGGERPYSPDPPPSPHRYFMRENCLACHGENSRSDIVNTLHPRRGNCRQCHLEQDRKVPLLRARFRSKDLLAK